MVLRNLLLFIFLGLFFHQVAFAAYVWSLNGKTGSGTTLQSACAGAAVEYGKSFGITFNVVDIITDTANPTNHTCKLNSPGRGNGSVQVTGSPDCPAQGQQMGMMGFTFNGTAPDDWLPPTKICKDKCEYDFAVATIAPHTSNNTTSVTGDATSRGTACEDETDGDDIPYECNKDVCDVPPDTDCPSTHTKGTFNGKTICVMNPDEATCTPTILEPYKCIPKPDEPTPPDAGGNCPAGKVQVRTPTGIKCMTENTPPDPNNNCPTDYISQTVNGTTTCTPNNQVPRGPGGGTCPVGTDLNTAENGDKTCKKSEGGDGEGEGDEDDTGEGGQSCNDAFFKKFCEAIDWLRKDAPLPKNPTTTVKDISLPDINTGKITWSSQCPASRSISVSFGGMSKSLEFKFDNLCNAFVTASPWVRAIAWLHAAFILLGVMRR